MARKVFYKYNPNTLSYERIYPSVGARIFSVCKYLLLSILIGIGFFLIFYHFFESPREKKLREDNEQMATQYRILSHRLDEALEVMSDVQQRDNNLYRIIMQANPIDSKARNAGIDNCKIWPTPTSLFLLQKNSTFCADNFMYKAPHSTRSWKW